MGSVVDRHELKKLLKKFDVYDYFDLDFYLFHALGWLDEAESKRYTSYRDGTYPSLPFVNGGLIRTRGIFLALPKKASFSVKHTDDGLLFILSYKGIKIKEHGDYLELPKVATRAFIRLILEGYDPITRSQYLKRLKETMEH